MDPIGFGLENFDGIGRWRAQDSGLDVDAAGELIDARGAEGSFMGPVELAGRLAASEQVRDCVATQWFRFGLGRERSYADACSLREASEIMAASGGDIKALLVGLVTSDSFRYRSAE